MVPDVCHSMCTAYDSGQFHFKPVFMSVYVLEVFCFQNIEVNSVHVNSVIQVCVG